MTQQKIKSRSINSGASQSNSWWTRWWPFITAALLIIVLPITLAVINHQRRSRQTSERLGIGDQSIQSIPTPPLTDQALKDTAWDPAWPPLPSAGTPAQPLEQVRAMYAFAARRPEVLQYAPCYCGCESGGHANIRDCFVKGRDADGKPQWDGMGFI